jgi:hypothetical protein
LPDLREQFFLIKVTYKKAKAEQRTLPMQNIREKKCNKKELEK